MYVLLNILLIALFPLRGFASVGMQVTSAIVTNGRVWSSFWLPAIGIGLNAVMLLQEFGQRRLHRFPHYVKVSIEIAVRDAVAHSAHPLRLDACEPGSQRDGYRSHWPRLCKNALA